MAGWPISRPTSVVVDDSLAPLGPINAAGSLGTVGSVERPGFISRHTFFAVTSLVAFLKPSHVGGPAAELVKL
jgi:hypothetical protein